MGLGSERNTIFRAVWMNPGLGAHPRAAHTHSVALSKALPCLALVSPALKCGFGLPAVHPCPWVDFTELHLLQHPACFPCMLTAPLGPQALCFFPFLSGDRGRTIESYPVLLLPCLLESLPCGHWFVGGSGGWGKCSVEGVEGKGLLFAA